MKHRPMTPASALTLPLLLGLAVLATPSAARADEAWHSQNADVTWMDEDVNGYSVLAYAIKNDAGEVAESGNLFVEGLRGSDAQRGTYQGYWTTDGALSCPEPWTDPYGNPAAGWGTLVLTFDKPEFPSGWNADLGSCGNPADRNWQVEPN